MKHKIALFAAVATLVISQSCNKIASNLHYDLSMNMASVDIHIPPMNDTTSNALLGTIVSAYNIDSFIKASTSNVLGTSNISSAKMVSCSMTLLNPSAANNFANMQSGSVIFFTNTDTTPFTAATVSSNPDSYAATLSPLVDATTELKPYMNGNQLTYSLHGKLRRVTTDTVTCRVQITMSVHVQG